jgi:hypothetical protein
MRTSTPLRMVFDPMGDELAAARACEAEIFLNTYGNTLGELRMEYGPYEDASVFIALLEPDGTALAACRIVTPGPAGLKSLNDAARPPWFADGLRSARAAGMDVERTWDVATIGVRPDAASSRMFAAAALYHGIFVGARANGIRSIVMVMDERARRLLTSASVITQTLPGTGPGPYLGSPASTPLYGHLAQMADVQRRVNPDAHRLIGLGIGLDGVSVPEPAAFRLDEHRLIAAARAESSLLATSA